MISNSEQTKLKQRAYVRNGIQHKIEKYTVRGTLETQYLIQTKAYLNVLPLIPFPFKHELLIQKVVFSAIFSPAGHVLLMSLFMLAII